MQALQFVAEGKLTIPKAMELRGPTHDEALLLRLTQAVPTLTAPAPFSDGDSAHTEQQSTTDEAEDKEETERIEAELAGMLNEEGVQV